ncbi:beta-class phenol-soluble modulin [Corynebacterium kalidii]|uniref:Beta-class phenol-soluble modulin n=1 Tax=Corynebacterium kalidii TaxID=2931982 RepID=A0A9X2B2B8_9CORY|nr:beta-class phenol-soluble modulin [Corynebacterium kalidii]MCJ7858959.1 beta-class phenol-soluble modulin [Corynebacterium kalidii]
MIDSLAALAESITGIVTTAISGDWIGLGTSIVSTVFDSIGVGSAAVGSAADLGSSAIELSS